MSIPDQLSRRTLAPLLFCAGFSGAYGNTFDEWNIHGTNTLRGSHYSSTGSASGSPYSIEGDLYFNDFNIYLSRQRSDYIFERAEISGVYNLNDGYRLDDLGVTPERMNFTRESGESALPYRVEIGDHFAYFSYMSLQSSLKGVQLELQPQTDIFGYKHSLLITSGASAASWRHLDIDENFSNGLSWVMQNEHSGYSFNIVHNSRSAVPEQNSPDRNQLVATIAGERFFNGEKFNLTIDAEAARFDGDHNGTATAGKDRSGNGYFLQINGRSKSSPLDFRIRAESYDEDFQPTGAIVTADRRSAEIHAGWINSTGIRMRGRIQFFEDGYESSNPIITETQGVTFSGPILSSFFSDAGGSLDVYLQSRDDETGSTENLSKNFNLSLSKPLLGEWIGRTNLFLQNVNDKTSSDNDVKTRQLSLSADHPFSLYGLTGAITPGMMVRSLRDGTESTDINPTLSVHLYGGSHSLSIDYGSLVQDRVFSNSGADIDTHTLSLDYRYSYRRHIFGLQTNVLARDPVPGESTAASRVSFYWTYDFDRPAVTGTQNQLVSRSGSVSYGRDGLSIRALTPGMSADKTQKLLDRHTVNHPVIMGNTKVYEYPIFNGLVQRQRLAIEFVAASLHRTALIIDFDDIGSRDSVAQTFSRVSELLIRQLGNPSRVLEKGEFTSSVVADLNTERFVRLFEWNTPSGVIRFGVPRRLDGQFRMEVQYAKSLAATSDTLWSVEAVR